MGRLAAAVAVALSVGLSPPVARAQSLDDARRLYLEADFRGAAEAYEGVLAVESDRLVLARAHAALSALRMMLGEEAEARAHAAAAVALDPEVVAPEGAPDDARGLLHEAGEESGGRPASVEIGPEGEVLLGETSVVVARLDPAPRLIAAALSLACSSGGSEAEERGPPPEVRLSLLALGDHLRCEAAALAPSGQTVLRAERELEVTRPAEAGDDPHPDPDPDPDPDPGPDPDPFPEPRRLWSGWIWIGVGSAVLVAAAVTAAILAVTLAPSDIVVLRETTIEGW